MYWITGNFLYMHVRMTKSDKSYGAAKQTDSAARLMEAVRKANPLTSIYNRKQHISLEDVD